MGSSPVTFVPATEAHAREIAANLRPADAAEVRASDGLDPLEALLVALEWSDPGTAQAALVDGQLMAVCGVVRGSLGENGVAYPWLLTTPVVDRHRAAFLRASRAVLAGWAATYPRLEQYIDARYLQALRWADWLGFQVDLPAPYGVAGLPFCRITKRRDGHV